MCMFVSHYTAQPPALQFELKTKRAFVLHVCFLLNKTLSCLDPPCVNDLTSTFLPLDLLQIKFINDSVPIFNAMHSLMHFNSSH